MFPGVKPEEFYTIRPALWDDCAAASRIDKNVKPEFFWPLKWFQEELIHEGTRFWVIENLSQVIGYCIWWQTETKMEILNIAVDRPHQRQGVGHHLFKKVLKEGIRAGLHFVDLELREDNVQAFSFYKKYRFLPVGLRKNYYRDGMHAILMRRAFL